MLKDNAQATLSLEHIADLVAQLSRRFMQDLAVLRSAGAAAEFAVLGWCPSTEQWRIFHVMPVVGNGNQTKAVEFIPSNADELLLLGDQKREIQEEVARVRANHSAGTLRWWRAPVEAMSQILEARKFDSIGGYLQMGTAVEATKGFNLSAVVQPIVAGQPISTFKFLGMDVRDDIGTVGPCFVGMSGMAIPR